MTKKSPNKRNAGKHASDPSKTEDAGSPQPDGESPFPDVLMENNENLPGPVDFWLARLKKSLRDR